MTDGVWVVVAWVGGLAVIMALLAFGLWEANRRR